MRAELHTDEPYQELEKLFRSELDRQHERSSVELHDDKGKTAFIITADDVSAMRAALNSVTSILRIWEDSK